MSDPGFYTGLRVGITTALALARTLDVGMVGVGSLDALAHGVRHHQCSIHAVIDARRGELFHAAFAAGSGPATQISPPAVVDPAELAASLASTASVVLAGDGIAAHPEAFEGFEGIVVDAGPRAEDVLALAAIEVAEGRLTDPGQIRPAYLREPDAVAKWGAA